MGKLRDYDKIDGWLYKTAGNISKQYAASRRKERAKTAPIEHSESGDWACPHSASAPREAPLEYIIAGNIQSEEHRIAEEKAIEQAACAIKRCLKPDDEEMLDLAFRQKQPLKEVAARLGISLSAAKSRVSRLRQKISALAHELLAD